MAASHRRWSGIANALLLLSAASLTSCHGGGKPPPADAPANPIVGTWIVKQDKAPFPFHLYVFNADGTMQQANPDAGDPRASDSDGKGVWAAKDGHVTGKWVEIMADRESRKYIGRGELSYDIRVEGNRLKGNSSFTSFDADGRVNGGPFPAPFSGERVTLP